MQFFEIVLAIGASAAALTAVFVAFEKVTGATTKWLARGVSAGTADLRDHISDLEHLTRYHLGPNGDAPKMHERVQALAHEVDEIRDELRGR
jgi:hypothetical protein